MGNFQFYWQISHLLTHTVYSKLGGKRMTWRHCSKTIIRVILWLYKSLSLTKRKKLEWSWIEDGAIWKGKMKAIGRRRSDSPYICAGWTEAIKRGQLCVKTALCKGAGWMACRWNIEMGGRLFCLLSELRGQWVLWPRIPARLMS